MAENAPNFYPPSVIATVSESAPMVVELERARGIELALPDLLMIYQLAKL